MAVSPTDQDSPAVQDAPERSGVSVVARIEIGLIHAYQAIRRGRPSPCRFVPSCSEYGAEAIAVHGAVRGSWFTARRISRCRPGGGSGVDLIPPTRQEPSHV